MLVATDDRFEDEVELLLTYGAQSWYDGSTVSFGLDLTGVAFATTENFEFGRNAIHQLRLTTLFNLDSVCPGLLLRLPFDDNLEFVNGVVGLTLGVPL